MNTASSHIESVMSSARTAPAARRYAELDVLRGVAAVAVVLYHYTVQYYRGGGHSTELAWSMPFGSYGVQLFFVISGFVIMMTLERTERGVQFVVSRFSRLYPAYWAAVLLTFSIGALSGYPRIERTAFEAAVNLSMIQELIHVRHVDGVYWTLTVELIFYGIMFTLYSARLLARIEWIAGLWLVLMLVPVAMRGAFGTDVPGEIQVLLLLQHGNLFIAGIMFHRARQQGFTVARSAMIGGALAVQFALHGFLSMSIVAAIFGVFIMFHYGLLRWIVCRPLMFLGGISYTLYLVHQNIGYLIINTAHESGLNPYVGVGAAFVAAVIVAFLISTLVERPAQVAIRTWCTTALTLDQARVPRSFARQRVVSE